MEGWKNGRMEKWKDGKLERWKNGIWKCDNLEIWV